MEPRCRLEPENVMPAEDPSPCRRDVRVTQTPRNMSTVVWDFDNDAMECGAPCALWRCTKGAEARQRIVELVRHAVAVRLVDHDRVRRLDEGCGHSPQHHAL
jgi:hypothetical protein